jgi:hypothetical protein
MTADKKEEKHDPQPLIEMALEHLQIYSIGLVAAEWGYAEAFFELLIWTLAGVDKHKGRSITTHLLSVTRQDIAKTLANETLFDPDGTELRNEVLAVIAEYDGLRNRRNKIIHANWKGDTSKIEDGGKRKTVSLITKARGNLEITAKEYDDLEIRNIAKDITKLLFRMSRLFDKLPKLPEPKLSK